ncbi:hypothetical protein KJ966_22590 [bacterium]|nr:hypothetical protein [bacterium]
MNPVTYYCKAILGDNQSAKKSLRLIPEFSDCSDRLLDMIFCYSKPVNLSPGETLIKEGLFDQWVYFIIKGDLDVIIGGKNLGSTSGPIVGERCILGEPRGANLVAGKSGLMALGVEMTIIDELFRQVNNYQKVAENDEDFTAYSEEKLSVALELLLIILSEIISRIINMHRTGLKTFDILSKSRPHLNIQLQSLYSFSDNSYEDTDETSNGIQDSGKTKKSEPALNIAVYGFDDFVDIVYFELLQKFMPSYGYDSFSQETWKEKFALDDTHNPTISKSYKWLKDEFGITNHELIEITYSIFEIASKYTAAANKSIARILAISDCEKEQQEAMSGAGTGERRVAEESQNEIRLKLFQPVEQTLKDQSQASKNEDPGKMSQADIDALF